MAILLSSEKSGRRPAPPVTTLHAGCGGREALQAPNHARRPIPETGARRMDDETAPWVADVVVRAGPSGFRTEVEAGPHRLVVDEPSPDGGAAAGPSPYDYLVAAVGACTAMTVRMYAD